MQSITLNYVQTLRGIGQHLAKLLSLSFLLSLLATTNLKAQEPPTCSSFSIEPSRTVEGGNTIFTFKITETSPVNDLSHWGFVFDVCTGTEQAFVDAATAQTSTSATGPWTDITIEYQDDPSEDCINENVLKFNQNMTGETSRWFRLIVPGDVNIEIGLAYIKYGSTCCVIDLNFGSCCPPLTVNDPADQELCAGEMTDAITFTGDITGTTFEWTNDNTSIGLAASGTGDIAAFEALNATNAPVVATITVTPTKDGCTGPSQTFTITVNPLPVIDAGSYDPVCQDAADVALLGTPSGGVWSGTGVSSDGSGGYVFDPSVGTQELTYTYTDGESCEGSDKVTIIVNTPPTVDAGSYDPVCSDAADIPLVGSPTGGVWTGTGVSSDGSGGYVFDPSAGTQELTYTYTDGNGCEGSDKVTITVTQRITVDAGDYGPLCDDGPKIKLGGTPAGGVWTGTGVTLEGTDYYFDPTAGTQTLTYTVDNNGCGGSDNTTITVTHCFEGCTPGYWKNHTSAWCYSSPSASFWTVFDISNRRGLASNLTLLKAVSLGGGGYSALARSAVAALQNSCHSNVDYPYSTSDILAAVKSMFQTGSATLGGTTYSSVEALKNELDRANNLGCPLNNSNMISSSSVLDEQTATMPTVTSLSVNAYPNPYTDVVKFVIQSPISGEATLKVSNVLGQTLATVYKGRIAANSSQIVEFRMPTPAPQAVIYTLTIGSERVVGKLLRANR